MPKILRYYLESESMAMISHDAGGSSVSMTYPVLSPASYTAWAIKVEAILDAQGLWEAMSPPGDGEVEERKSKMARAQLLQALPKDILMQVSTKNTTTEVWASLKTRFIGADRVKTACLATLKGEFDKLYMEDGEKLDDYAGKISGMAAHYAGLGATLDDATVVKKLLDTVPNRLFPAVAGIEQFCDVETMAFEEALSRLKAFDERSRRRTTRRPALSHGGRVEGSVEEEESGLPLAEEEEALLADADEEATLL